MSFTHSNASGNSGPGAIRKLAQKIHSGQKAAWDTLFEMPPWLIDLAEKFPAVNGADKGKAEALFSWLSQAQLKSTRDGYIIYLKSPTWKQMTEQFMLPKISLEEISRAMGGPVSLA